MAELESLDQTRAQYENILAQEIHHTVPKHLHEKFKCMKDLLNKQRLN